MGLTDIKTETFHIEEYSMSFEWNDCPGDGFGFPCNKDGSVDLSTYSEAAIENLASCLFGIFDVSYTGIEDQSKTWTERSGKCACGRTVVLEGDYGHGIDCECGRIYNSSGQELRPRSQWEDRWEDDSTQPYNVEFGYAGSDY